VTSKPRIAIVGAGLGGTAAATILQRNGYDVQVYEQAKSFARIGAGINLTPNVTRALGSIGFLERMLEVGLVPEQRLSREWDSGEVTYEIPVKKFPELYGGPLLTMHRGDLQDILSSGVRPDSIHMGKRLVGLEDRESSVRLIFSDGSSAEAEFVIGADGINSKVREILRGPEAAAYSGWLAHRAIFSSRLLGGLKVPDLVKWWAEDRHVLIYYLTHTRNEIHIVTNVQAEWDAKEFAPRPVDMKEVREALRGFHSEVQQVVAACPEATKWPILEREPFPLWSRGRIVLLGDACHPMQPTLGQGAAMAIEDAVVLARAILAVNGEDPLSAYRLYEGSRFERTARVQNETKKTKWLRYPMDPSWLYSYDAWSAPLTPISGLQSESRTPGGGSL
jgi:6-hydroxynicotinate 3-monooxygenase